MLKIEAVETEKMTGRLSKNTDKIKRKTLAS